MKILYNEISCKKGFKHFNEWYFFRLCATNIKTKGRCLKKNFMIKNLFLLIVCMLLAVLWIDVYLDGETVFDKFLGIIAFLTSIFCIIFYVFVFINYFIYYRNFKNTKIQKKKNSLTINEDGITDITSEITLSSKWEQLTHVLIGEYYIAIVTVTFIIYIFPIDVKDRLVSSINKYNTNKELHFINVK